VRKGTGRPPERSRTGRSLAGALSTTLAGAVIVLGGYDLAFFTLAGIAVLALGLFALAVPETSPTETVLHPGPV
jgi:dolichol kinase